VLLHSDRVVRAALKSEVVCKNHAFLTVNHADARNNITRRNSNVVTSKLANLKEGRTTVNNSCDAFSGGTLVSFQQLFLLALGDEHGLLHSRLQLNIHVTHGEIIRLVDLTGFVNLLVEDARIVLMVVRVVSSVQLLLKFVVEVVFTNVPGKASLSCSHCRCAYLLSGQSPKDSLH